MEFSKVVRGTPSQTVVGRSFEDTQSDKLKDFIKFLDSSKVFYYEKGLRSGFGKTIVFEAEEKEAREWANKWILGTFPYAHKEECDFDLNPYPLNEYSALVELLEGKTNSPHIENYNFSDYPVQQQWIDGCIEVAEAAKEFYNDYNRYSTYYSSNGNQNYEEERLTQLDYIERFLKKFKIK